MKKHLKNVLIFGATSDVACELINILLKLDVVIYAVSRGKLNIEHKNLKKFNTDLSLEENVFDVFKNFNGIKFDTVLNFQGVAISSPVEVLSKEELQKQLDISLFSLLSVLKSLPLYITDNATVVAISSMASFGIYPFLSPYSISKASSDILLSAYEIETGIKTVSIKLGVIGTKFWKFCVDENEKNFEKFMDKYENVGKYLKDNALKNANKGLSPKFAAKAIYKIITRKNPKASYLLGNDARFTSFISMFKGRFLFSLIRKVLKFKVMRFLNEG